MLWLLQQSRRGIGDGSDGIDRGDEGSGNGSVSDGAQRQWHPWGFFENYLIKKG